MPSASTGEEAVTSNNNPGDHDIDAEVCATNVRVRLCLVTSNSWLQLSALSEDTTFETFRIEYDKLARALTRSLDTEKKLLKTVRVKLFNELQWAF